MADNESYQIDKLLPFKAKPNTRAYIKDGDLQIQVSHSRDAAGVDPAASNFQGIYSHLKNEAVQAADVHASNQTLAANDVREMMEDAKSTFDSMMQIREELNKAYRELMQLQ